jgi:hypothetical protein
VVRRCSGVEEKGPAVSQWIPSSLAMLCAKGAVKRGSGLDGVKTAVVAASRAERGVSYARRWVRWAGG